MNPAILVAIAVVGTKLFFYLRPLRLLNKDRMEQESLINPGDPETADLRITSKVCRSVVYDFGKDFEYIKFRFTKDECFVYLCDSLRAIYHGPMLIKDRNERPYSYLAKMYITRFSVQGQNVTVSFGHKSLLGMRYTFHLSDVSEHDIALLKANLG